MDAKSGGLVKRLLLAAMAGLVVVTVLTLLGPLLFSNFRPRSFGVATFLPAWVVSVLGWPSLVAYAGAAVARCCPVRRIAAFGISALVICAAFVGIAVWAQWKNVNEADLVTQVYLAAALCHLVSQAAMAATLVVSKQRRLPASVATVP